MDYILGGGLLQRTDCTKSSQSKNERSLNSYVCGLTLHSCSSPLAPPSYPLWLFVGYSGSSADCKTRLDMAILQSLDWTGGLDRWSDTKNHFYT